MFGIIDFVIDVYIIFFILRLALEPRQFYFNPMLQPIRKATEVFMKPLRTVFKPTSKGFDYTPFFGILILVFLRSCIIYLLVHQYGGFTSSLFDSSIKLLNFVFQVFVVLEIMSIFIYRTTVNPIGRFVYQVLEPVNRPLEKLFPRLRNWIILPAIILLVLLHVIVIYSLSKILGLSYSLPFTIHYSLIELIAVIRFFYIIIIIGALMSWISPDPGNPIVQIIHQIMEPMLRPVRKFIPTIGGIDFSPIIVIFALVYLHQFLQIFIDQIFFQGMLNF